MIANIAETLRTLRKRAGFKSLEALAKAAGYARATSLARYESPRYMKGRRLPSDVAARLVRALAGKGSPPIAESEIWALCDAEPALRPVVLTAIRVFRSESITGATMLKSVRPAGLLELNGAEPHWLAVEINGDACARVAPDGAIAVLNPADAVLIAGRLYGVILGGGFLIVRYQQNPERRESQAIPAAPPATPREAVDVIGRLVQTIKRW